MFEKVIIYLKVLRFVLIIPLLLLILPGIFKQFEKSFIAKKHIVVNIPKVNKNELKFRDFEKMQAANMNAYGKTDDKSNGWFVSSNLPQKNHLENSDSSLKLFLEEEVFEIDKDNYVYQNLYLINNTGEKICLNAQDSRLYIKLLAKDFLGRWLPIEYIPSSWCGNSYHTVCLEDQNLWKFRSNNFKGRYRTDLKYVLLLKNGEIFSNVFSGYVNTGQFLSKETYLPVSLMDPYN